MIDPHSGIPELQWSPIGDVLAYAKFGSSPGAAIGLWEVVPGGQPFALVSTPGVVAFFWSPSGRQIAYQLSGDTPTPAKVASYSGAGIWLVNADGSDARKLADGSFVIYSSNPWSSDGRLLAYWKNVSGGSALSGDAYVIDTETGHEISLGRVGGDDRVQWSPSRSRPVFYNLAINTTTDTAAPLFDPGGSLIDWSPDGTKVAYVQYAPAPTSRSSARSHSLVVLDIDSGQQTTYETSTVDLWVHEPGYRGDWSPDSRYFAFIGAEQLPDASVASELYVADTQSGRTNRVLTRGAGAGYVWYSPDGRHLLIQQGFFYSQPSIWVARDDGAAAVKLVDGTVLWPYDVTPWRPILH